MGGKAALLLVVGFSLTYLVIGQNFGSLSTRAVENLTNYYEETASHNIAVSGANMAAHEIFKDPTWTAGYNNLSFSGGNLNVTVQVVDAFKNIRRITSIGKFQGITKKVSVTLQPSKFSKFAYYSIYEGGSIWWTGAPGDRAGVPRRARRGAGTSYVSKMIGALGGRQGVRIARDHAREREVTGERAAHSFLALDLQGAVMALQCMFHDRKTQARAAHAARTARIDAIETFRQAWNVFFGDAHAGVAYRQVRAGCVGPPAQLDFAFGRRVLHRVRNEIGGDGMQLRFDTLEQRIALQLQSYVARMLFQRHHFLAQQSQQRMQVVDPVVDHEARLARREVLARIRHHAPDGRAVLVRPAGLVPAERHAAPVLHLDPEVLPVPLP